MLIGPLALPFTVALLKYTIFAGWLGKGCVASCKSAAKMQHSQALVQKAHVQLQVFLNF